MLRVPAGAPSAVRLGILVVLTAAGHREEARRRQLVRIAGHDCSVRSHERADRVGRGDLGRLVEDDDVEATLRGKQLGYQKWAHRPTRLQRAQHMWGSLEKLPYREVATFQPRLMLDDIGFLRPVITSPGRVLRYCTSNTKGGSLDMSSVRSAEGADGTSMSIAVESANMRVGEQNCVEDGAEPDLLKTPTRLVDGEVAAPYLGDQGPESGAVQVVSKPDELRQPREGASIGQKGIEQRSKRREGHVRQV